MSNYPSNTLLDPLNRRKLLGAGAALMSGAFAASAQEKEKPKAGETSAKPAAASASPVGSPNLHPPVVQVKGGKLRGFKDGKTFTFLGVPYAEAERFELPKPVQPWEGIKNAQYWGPVCPVPAQTTPWGNEFVFPHRYWVENEHCQVVNVWSQSLGAKAKKPVMVWMHGGGSTNGSCMEAYAYDGKNLSEFGDVVVVSVNHRLNILGTLDLSAFGAQYAQSRYTGTADLVAALQWVHDNIETFGGDPGNVTIFGQSGGGGKVVRMMHMPVAKGLFHKVIAQSGSASYRDSDVAANIKAQQAIAAATLKELGLDGSQIDKLKKVAYKDLIAAGTAALRTAAREVGRGNLGWDVIADDQYVMREFCDWADSIPLIAGTVFSENISTLEKGDGRKNYWTAKEAEEHVAKEFGDKAAEVAAEFKKAYPRKKAQDVIFYAGTSRPGPKRVLARKLEKGKAPVYNYVFAYEYPVNDGITSFHCSEIVFAFHNLSQPQSRVATGGTPSGFALQDKVSQAWINFARSGNPSQPGLVWKPFTVKEQQAMVFDTVSESRPLQDDKLVSLLLSGARR
jgi:para-nitrobenzyl esterase